jgi:undecaprenyl diphosphate synthase
MNSSKNKKIELDLSRIPKHIGIIMDGNGRWATLKGLPRTMGHKAGVEAISEIVSECGNLGVKYLTLYAFSTENWKRPKEEVDALMQILVDYLQKKTNELNNKNIVINSIGAVDKLPQKCQDELAKAYEITKNNNGLTLNLALNYGGRQEIINAIKKLNEAGEISTVTEETFSKYLYTSNMPDPDLIIRPSGELRLSNFLIWQSAYSELWFSDINWPDFKKDNFLKAISDYQKRDRRFGSVK